MTFAGDKPDMYHLEHFKVIKEMADKWKKLASLLGLSDVVPVIDYDTAHFGFESSFRETIRRWLDGEGHQPITWKSLVEALRDANESEITNELQKHFQIVSIFMMVHVHYS